MKRIVAFVAACASLACVAQERRAYELRLEGAHENLDHGQPDWNEFIAQLAWRPKKDFTILGGARTTERFDQRDREGFAGIYLPLGDSKNVLHIEGAASSTHKVLARNSVLAEIGLPVGSGWVLTPAAKLARYSTGDVTLTSGTIEKYIGAYRFGYTAYLSRVEGGPWSPAHRLAASWYGATELTYATLSFAKGRDVENVYPLPLIVTDVRGASLAGGMQVAPDWGLVGEIGYVKQGDLYARRGARIGTRILF